MYHNESKREWKIEPPLLNWGENVSSSSELSADRLWNKGNQNPTIERQLDQMEQVHQFGFPYAAYSENVFFFNPELFNDFYYSFALL